MTLWEFYKREVYANGYSDGQEGRNNGVGTIYYEDEMDFYICQEYYGQYVGSVLNWTEDEVKFLEILGFEPEDFEDPEAVEDE